MERKRIVCYGDSGTWGYIGGSGLRYDEDTRWTGRIQKMLGDGYAVVEAGLNGRTTIYDDPQNPYANGYTYMKPILLSAAPIDLLIFSLGINDFQTQVGRSAVDTARGIRMLVQEAVKLGVNRPGEQMKILIIAPSALNASLRLGRFPIDNIDETSVANSKILGGLLRQVASMVGASFLDANDYDLPRSEADGTHVTAEAHAILADVICKRIRELLP